MKRYFIDLEFWERGNDHPIVPLSIGVLGETEGGLYLINGAAPLEEVWRNTWMRDNVLRHFPITVYSDERDADGVPRLEWNEDSHLYDQSVFSPLVMAARLEEYLGVGPYYEEGAEPIELWADWSAYDHVCLAQLWGSMMQLPKGLPMRTHDTQQLIDDWDLREDWKLYGPAVETFVGPGEQAHNALADAAWCREVWRWAQQHRPTMFSKEEK